MKPECSAKENGRSGVSSRKEKIQKQTVEDGPKKCEVVQVVFGDEALLLLQKDVSEKGTTGEAESCLIKVKEGQKILIPPGYGYSIINPLSTKPLIVATWRHADSRGKKQLYKEGKPRHMQPNITMIRKLTHKRYGLNQALILFHCFAK